ncbi:MAG: hypothetical protein ACOYM7_07790 [Paludibacter sp.]
MVTLVTPVTNVTIVTIRAALDGKNHNFPTTQQLLQKNKNMPS